jgi:hypothetical protein
MQAATLFLSTRLPIHTIAAAGDSLKLNQICNKFVHCISFFHSAAASRTMSQALVKLMDQPRTLPILVGDGLPCGLPGDWRVIRLHLPLMVPQDQVNPTTHAQKIAQYLRWIAASPMETVSQELRGQETVSMIEGKLMKEFVNKFTVNNHWHTENAGTFCQVSVGLSALLKPIKEITKGSSIAINRWSICTALEALGFIVTNPKN